jgi:hypothetical protein
MPTEIEKLERARLYIEQLANGVDPISGLELPEDSALNQVRLSRCFFYVADVLGQVIANGGQVQRATGSTSPLLPPFELPMELREQIPIEQSVMIKRFTESINALADLSAMRKLKMTAFTGWLVAQGYLREDMFNGKRRKVVTDKGRAAGITDEQRQGQHGGYTATLYDENAQRLMIARLDEIIALSNGTQEME